VGRRRREGREFGAEDGVVWDVCISGDDGDKGVGTDEFGCVNGRAGNLLERKMLQVGHGGSDGDDKVFPPIIANTANMDGWRQREKGDVQWRLVFITALADRQYSELVEMLEERDDRLFVEAVEGESELLDSTRKFASQRPVFERLLDYIMISKQKKR
jgi:hypothetical protein